ncbi:MAG TPA: LPS assembly protein LptD, partial [Rhodanobacteraceae bacterium]|nr:LPS assembly protein LptD [Rhodanobacteraceae bacterium]
MPSRFSLPPLPQALALAILAALPGAAAHAANPPADASMCGVYPLLAERLPAIATDASTEDTRALADSVHSRDGTHFRFDGQVSLHRDGDSIRASALDWNNATTAWQASGPVYYQSPSLLLRAAAMQGTSTPRHASGNAVDYQMLDARGNGHASHFTLTADNRAQLTTVSYSTCPPAARGWELRADRVEINQNTHVGRAHDVSLRLGKTPIFWLPYLRFPTSDARQSGVLYPTLGYSNDRGFDITVPWYLNLAPNYDATLYPRLLSRRGGMLGVEFRYLTAHSRGEFRYDYLPHDRLADRSRSLLRARSETRLSPDWRFVVNLNHISDRRYFEDMGDSLSRSATQLLPSSVYLRGGGEWWSAAVGADRYQIADPDLSDNYEPYQRL